MNNMTATTSQTKQNQKTKVAMMMNKGTVRSSDSMMIKLCSEPLSLPYTTISDKNNSLETKQ